MNKYQPKMTEGPNGVWSGSYGEAHALRQADAAAALTNRDMSKESCICVVRHAAGGGQGEHPLARVYDTQEGRVIVVDQNDADDNDISQAREQLDAMNAQMEVAIAEAIAAGEDPGPDDLTGLGRVTYKQSRVTDFLDESDDFDLEARCRCGSFLLDRAQIQAAISRNKSLVIVPRL